uniref:OsmC family protein n=1 Tax=Flavobacterium sp. TaxID=239 RepID=UPI00404A768D
MTHEINTKWENDFHFISSLDNKEIHFDATALAGNHNLGVSPKTIILSGLSGCTGMDVVALLNKKFKVHFSNFDISVSGELTETRPSYYDKIHILYRIKVADADQEKVNEAINLSVTKYCGVHEMLSKAATITHEVKFL